MSWEVDGDENPRLDMFVVSSSASGSRNRVYGRHKIDADGRWTDWADLGPGAGSSVQVCRARDDRIYLWTVDEESRNITQNSWVPNPNAEARKIKKRQSTPGDDDDDDEDEEEPDEDEDGDGNNSPGPGNPNPDPDEPGNWAFTGSETWNPASDPAQGPAASAPGVACRSSSILHDLIWYDDDAERAWHQSYNDSASSWSEPRSFEGDWVGSPSVFSYSSLSASSDEPQRFDFFGVQANNEVYTFSWTASDGYSRMTSLGGSIVSNPVSIIMPNAPSTRDVFALGSNGKIQHQHYDGTGWAREWEVLDIKAWSAPSAVVFDDGAWVFWLGEGGSLMGGRMEADEGGAEWADQLSVEDLGGDLTLEYFITEE